MPSPGGLHFRYASDQSLFVDFESTAAGEIPRFLRALEHHPIRGLRNLHPAYTSVLAVFDPLRIDHATLEACLAGVLQNEANPAPEPRLVEIPAVYGGADGPDLDDVAALHGIPAQRVIELHSAITYTVAFLGFVPGFAYLTGLSEQIATPRLPTPRRRVPAGSIGIAGSQTGVYPFATPGGWRIVARTAIEMFRPGRDPMSLLAIGDRVRFLPA